MADGVEVRLDLRTLAVRLTDWRAAAAPMERVEATDLASIVSLSYTPARSEYGGAVLVGRRAWRRDSVVLLELVGSLERRHS